MAPAAIVTPAPGNKTNGTIDVETAKVQVVAGLASAAASTPSSTASPATNLTRSSSASSDVSVASSTLESFSFESVHVETALHKASTKLWIDTAKDSGDLVAEGVLVRGVATTIRFSLTEYLGNIDGKLEWNGIRYQETSEDIKIVVENDACFIEAKCKHKNQTLESSRFNLSEKLYIFRGQFQLRDGSFSTMLSEVPWMKFKVVAEPDYSVFTRDPVVKSMMMRIAQSTVEHVTAQMNQHIKAAMENATELVMTSAMQHVAEQMQVIVQGATVGGKAQRSSTTLAGLHII